MSISIILFSFCALLIFAIYTWWVISRFGINFISYSDTVYYQKEKYGNIIPYISFFSSYSALIFIAGTLLGETNNLLSYEIKLWVAVSALLGVATFRYYRKELIPHIMFTVICVVFSFWATFSIVSWYSSIIFIIPCIILSYLYPYTIGGWLEAFCFVNAPSAMILYTLQH